MLNVMINFDTNCYHSATIVRNDGRPSPSRCHRHATQRHIYQKGRQLSFTFKQLHITTLQSS